ncbi:uncharacterized protein MELLADRAFT_42986 [Melampsora larici-populina 98AG31]|uniref:Major facilitator superfamily (MFS) profile domain-containing protein n=1 Tax=Melampsora larici-populina (strain 98AG31 / pathotype 3-4-7) TaxID=747676 RepID=F4RHQ9_MELLP|nr:uncharacterized protein MELLADRAFT_42986 [Melampsora larici-populina 98AG31]EGG08090.1 hypothetical protein MELLADRAFT_42986 [Melampsora larici-populina 98AG31]
MDPIAVTPPPKTISDFDHPMTKSDQPQDRQVDLGERRRAALAEIDNARFGWFHVRAVLVSGVGFFTDAYDIFAINLASTMLGYVLHNGGSLSANQDLGIKVATPVGTFCGQLLFGWLADVYGRKRMYGIELMIIIISTLGQAVTGSGHAISLIGVLIMWRFFMGLGIGGDYPLSACITSEFAAVRIRGRMMTAVFASQGFGQLTASLVSLVVVKAYHSAIINDASPGVSVDGCWRLLIGLGAVPGAIALYFRLTIPETPRFTMDIERDVKGAAGDVDAFLSTGGYAHDYENRKEEQADVPTASSRDFLHHYSHWKNFKVLFGCAWSWFALDIAFYGLGLNSSIVLTAIGFGSVSTGSANEKIYSTLINISVGNIILSLAGLIPGYWATFAFIDKWGRKPIQIMGFSALTVLFIVMGVAYHSLIANALPVFIVLYCFANFFQNFGPNTTTFVIPGECFPTRYRSTSHGISAASGKLGAIVAQVGFARLKDIGGKDQFIDHIFEIFAAFMFTGLLTSFLVPETKGKTLEELSGEDQGQFVRSEANDQAS